MFDWLASHTQLAPEQLGPKSLRAVIRLSVEQELFGALDQAGALGVLSADGTRGDIRWTTLYDHLRDRLQLSPFNLKVGLHRTRQDKTPAREFARFFE